MQKFEGTICYIIVDGVFQQHMGSLMERWQCFLDTGQWPASGMMASLIQAGYVICIFILVVILFHGILEHLKLVMASASHVGYTQKMEDSWVYSRSDALFQL